MLKTFYKKIKGVYQTVIGTATVVTPELVINKDWDINSDYIGNAMRVPSKNFYDYLGHTIVNDDGLNDASKGGIGLGIGPYNNDLGRAVDRDTFSTPSPLAFNTDYVETGDLVTGTNDNGTQVRYTTTGDAIPQAVAKTKDYEWEGTWGDTQNKFQTSATFQVKINYNVKKTGGGVFPSSFSVAGVTVNTGIPIKGDTGALSFHVLCGSENDLTTEEVKLYYNGGQSNQSIFTTQIGKDPTTSNNPLPTGAFNFFNPHYSSGSHFFRDDDIGTILDIFTVHRKPFEEKLKFFTMYAGEAGEYQPFPSQQAGTALANALFNNWPLKILKDLLNVVGQVIYAIVSALNAVIGIVASIPGGSNAGGVSAGFNPNLGDALRDGFAQIFTAIFDILNKIITFIQGGDPTIPAYLTIEVKEIYREEMTIDQDEFAKTKMGKRWDETINEKSFLFSQMYYPYIFENPIFPFSDTFNYKEPYLLNKVVENNFYNDNVRSNNPFTKKYKYFIPSLFSLLYETNLGVFYEQLVKLHKNTGISSNKPDVNFNIKLVDHETPEDYWEKINKQQPCVYDLMLPSNKDFSENLLLDYAENTGYTDNTDATGSTIGQIVSGASAVDSRVAATLPSEYASVYSDYPFLNGFKGSVQGINTVIGNFSELKGKIETLGYDLAAWTNLCNVNSGEFQTLSSGSPKNLSYKLVEYILWYIEPQGIVEQTRQSVESLINYEKIVNDDIDEWRNSADGTEYDKYHIIGTGIYDRNCPPS